MGVGDGRADRAEELQALANGQTVLARVGRDGHSVDVLHDEVELAGGRCTAVDEPCDIRVLQLGQNLPLPAELSSEFGRIWTGFHDLHGHLLAILSVIALSQIHHAHAAFAQSAEDSIRPRVFGIRFHRRVGLGRGIVPPSDRQGERGLPVGLEAQQILNFEQQPGVPLAGLLDEAGASGGGLREGSLKQGLDAYPFVASHAV